MFSEDFSFKSLSWFVCFTFTPTDIFLSLDLFGPGRCSRYIFKRFSVVWAWWEDKNRLASACAHWRPVLHMISKWNLGSSQIVWFLLLIFLISTRLQSSAGYPIPFSPFQWDGEREKWWDIAAKYWEHWELASPHDDRWRWRVSRVGGVFESPTDRTGLDVQDKNATMATRKRTDQERGLVYWVGLWKGGKGRFWQNF